MQLAPLFLFALLSSGCPGNTPPAEPDPGPSSYETDMPAEPTSLEPAPPPPEAGRIHLGAAMLIGGEGLTDDAQSAASKAFMKAFDDGISHFRQCYAPGLEKNPSLSGQVDVRVVLDQSGNIYELKLTSAELDDPAVVDCIVSAFRKLRYAPLQGGRFFSVTAPVKLDPK